MNDTDSLFPSTRLSDLESLLGPEREDALRRYMLERYHTPLIALCRALQRSRWNGCETLGEPEELVAEFLLDRTRGAQNLLRWKESSKRLRHWLRNGFHYFLREQKSARRRRLFAPEVPDLPASPAEDPDRVFDRAMAWEQVHRVHAQVRAQCHGEGLGAHWQAMELHHLQGHSYQECAEQLKLPGAARAERMCRTVRDRIHDALRADIRAHVANDDEVDAELRDLLEALRHDR